MEKYRINSWAEIVELLNSNDYEEIKDVMSMTGFINFFEITDNIDNALKIF